MNPITHFASNYEITTLHFERVKQIYFSESNSRKFGYCPLNCK